MRTATHLPSASTFRLGRIQRSHPSARRTKPWNQGPRRSKNKADGTDFEIDRVETRVDHNHLLPRSAGEEKLRTSKILLPRQELPRRASRKGCSIRARASEGEGVEDLIPRRDGTWSLDREFHEFIAWKRRVGLEMQRHLVACKRTKTCRPCSSSYPSCLPHGARYTAEECTLRLLR